MIKLLIADDQEMIRSSLEIILSCEKDLEVKGTVENGAEVLDFLEKQAVDVILMDIRMPVMDGVLCTKKVKARWPDTKVIILTTFDDDDFVFSALQYGASGYLLKAGDMDTLHHAIETVYSGGAMINPDIARKVVDLFSQVRSTPIIDVDERSVDSISEMEWEVVRLIGRGCSNKEIAEKLFLSEGTVRNYLSRILSKLGLRDRTQVAIWAVENGYAGKRHEK
ncbi:response regulator transcription factor [Erysipelotrichaceae bacterium 66-17]